MGRNLEGRDGESATAEGAARTSAERTVALLDSLYDSAPIGLGFWDRELRYVRVNDALAQINERPAGDHVGRTFQEVVPHLAHVIEPIARRVLETKEAIVALEVSAGPPSEPEALRDWLASYYPVLAADGEVLGVGCVIEDVTERRRAERRTALAHEVTHILADADSVASASRQILATICERLGWDLGCYWSVASDVEREVWARAGEDGAPRFSGFVAITERAALDSTLLPGRVAAAGEPEWLEELTPDRIARFSVADAEGLRSGVAFPVVAEGEVLGVLELYATALRRFDPEAQAALVAIGAQFGQFVLRKAAEDERLDLLRRERQARAEAEAAASTLRKLQRVSEVALEQRSLEQLLTSLLERICEVLDAETAAILLTGDDGLLRVRATVGLAEAVGSALAIPIGAGMAGRVAATREALVVPDLSEIELASPMLRERGINSLVAIPLVVDEQVFGVLHAGSAALAHFTDEDARLLELIADRIALAINQAALSEAERAAQERLRFLSEASIVLSSSLDLDLTLRRAAQLATVRFADAAVIDLLVAGRLERVVIEVAEPRLSGAVRDGLFANPPAADDLGGSAKVVRTGEPEILLDLEADPTLIEAVTAGRPAIAPTVEELRPKSLVYMPLKARGTVLGVLALIRTTERFDARDIETVRELAARAAVSVDNAYLYREAELGRERLGILAEASSLLGSSLDVDATLDQVTALLRRTLAERCEIVLADVPGGDQREAVVSRDPPTIEVPLLARDSDVGTLTLRRADGGHAFTANDVELATEIARRAAVALDNARLFHAAEERAQAARVLASVGDGVFLVDRQGIVRTWNRAAETATRLRARDVIGRPAAEAIPGWSDVAARVPLAAPGTSTPRAESLPLDLGARELWLSVHGVSVPDGTVFAFRDLTEERALEAMRTEFVSTVSHELRTPLAAIYGAAMTLRRSDVSLGEDQRARLLDVVSGEADRLARTVNDILWASRLDAGSLHVSIQRCDPLELADAVVEAQRAHLDAEHELVLDADDELPAVAGDPDKVGRVLINLVDNAIKYSPDGGRVEVSVRRTGTHVRFSVHDEGLGIPLAEQRRIFEKFYRLDPNMTRGVGGTGLGLFICRELLRRMDGRIWVDSPGLGRGATFHMELPVVGGFLAHA